MCHSDMFAQDSNIDIAGRVFSREDLEFIAQLCIEHNVYVLADEGASPRSCSLRR